MYAWKMIRLPFWGCPAYGLSLFVLRVMKDIDISIVDSHKSTKKLDETDETIHFSGVQRFSSSSCDAAWCLCWDLDGVLISRSKFLQGTFTGVSKE